MQLVQRMVLGLALLIAVSTVGCSSSSGSPTAPTGLLQLTSADLLVAGQSMNGRTVMVGHGVGEQALFMAELMTDGSPAIGHVVWAEVNRPIGIMGRSRRFQLYDDGTHGDPVAHDGEYHFEDTQSSYACNGAGMMAGEYRYQFYGESQAGAMSNRLQVRVVMAKN